MAEVSSTSTGPPKLPPRKPLSLQEDSSSGQINHPSPASAASLEVSTRPSGQVIPSTGPPPLPPRTPFVQPVGIASPVPSDVPMISTPVVAVTPASPVEQAADVIPVPPPMDHKSARSTHTFHGQTPISSPITAGGIKLSSPGSGEMPSGNDLRAAIPSSNEHTTPPSIEWLTLTVVLVVVTYISAYFRFSFFYVMLFGSLGVGYVVHVSKNGADGGDATGKDDARGHEDRGGRAAVDWVNHALYALFPLISTDVLTPFIDLMEDALIEQVPPMVTSARIVSPALGSQPVLLTSLKPLSDQEWFASLSTSGKSPYSPTTKNHFQSERSHRHSLSADFRPKSLANRKSSHSRSKSSSAASLISPERPESGSGHSRSGSHSLLLDPEHVAAESRSRRKRDKILQKISGRRGRAPRKDTNNDLSTGTSRSPEKGNDMVDSGNGLSAADSGVEAHLNAERTIGGQGEKEMEEDDPDVGQYVNYQIGFEYKRSEISERKGWGLHMLAYFGVGLKGVGSAEIPIYIDVLSLTGTLNVRLLLSASPPFVRTGTFSFSSLPEFDISAKPLKNLGLGSFNAVRLPGMKSYIRSSIAQVAEAFVRPESYSLDVDRLLLGKEAALRTTSVGVLEILIHGARDLPKTDAIGTCDPYVAVSWTKFNKPLYSTRTIIDTKDPVWEESAFVLVTSDAIGAGERLKLRVVDSDRFSADDAIGIVELDLADLVEESISLSSPKIRNDRLQAEKRGMKVSGILDWSVRFCPLWQMPVEEMEKRMKAAREKRLGEPSPEDVEPPRWLKFVQEMVGESPSWEKERKQRRKETLAWFTGEKERDEMEAAARPPGDLRSGILQFHIHQCNDLEVESLAGTYSSDLDSRTSAVGGKPALSDVVDRGSTENPDPPSSYCEVYLNDKLVYRTRTKQVTPLPYFNAVSERFIRDWQKARITFVVRDERDREHDPILGLVNIRLKDALADRCQFTRWFPLIGGLGWGRIRLSLLFKPIDIRLPPGIAGFEVATLEIRSLTSTDLTRTNDKSTLSTSIVIETEADRHTLSLLNKDSPTASIEGDSRLSIDSARTSRTAVSNIDSIELKQVEWEMHRPVRLAVEYRHSCSVLLSFVSRSQVLKKKKIQGLGIIRLDDVRDSEIVERTVPIFGTSNVKDASKAAYAFSRSSITASSGSLGQGSEGEMKPIGSVKIVFVLHPGISRAHKKLCKRDLRFRKVYEVWEMGVEANQDISRASAGEVLKQRMEDGEQGSEDEDVDDDSESDDRGDDGDGDSSVRDGEEISLDYDEGEDAKGFLGGQRAHSKALHKRNKGVFQLKIARTGKFVKDKIESKFLTGATAVGARDRRPRGTDMEVEQEGQSKL